MELDPSRQPCPMEASGEAFPFIAERRLVIVHDLLKSQKAGKERDELRTYLERVPETCALVFVESEDFDKRGAVFTYLKKVGDVRDPATQVGAVINERAQKKILEYVEQGKKEGQVVAGGSPGPGDGFSSCWVMSLGKRSH